MPIKLYDIVQVVPEHKWCGCLVIVTEVKNWGIQGFVQVPMQGQAFIRLNHEDFEKVGEATFVLGNSNEE